MESTDNINTDVISPGVSLDFGVDLTDGTANEHADENNIEQNVVCAAVVKHKFKRHVVTKASLMKAIQTQWAYFVSGTKFTVLQKLVV